MATWIGTSGWSYDHWTDVVYPAGTPDDQRLEWYAKKFNTVELNSSFYHWPRENTFVRWHDRVPDDFIFTLKATRVLTHIKRLKDPGRSIELMEKGIAGLKEKMGVLLIQLPPVMEIDLVRLEAFLSRLPKERRTVVEFRHPSWQVEETYALLRSHGAGYCITNGAGLPCIPMVTAPFAYIRFHGPDETNLYAGSYSDEQLENWAKTMKSWQRDKLDIYVYFNNDGEGNAVRNAETLMKRLED